LIEMPILAGESGRAVTFGVGLFIAIREVEGMDKVFSTIEAATADIQDGVSIAIGGFFAAGVPRSLLQALIRRQTTGLTLACGSGPLMGAVAEAVGLIENGQIKKIIDSYGLPRSAAKGRDNLLEQKIRSGEIELEVYPMGTLAEKYRAGGAGIAAFYVRTGIGTAVAEETITSHPDRRSIKETRSFGGEQFILEHALRPDYAFVHAYIGDREGNLVYRKTARNFNHVMAMAGRITIAEVEKIVEPGEIEPDRVQTPGIFVQRVVQVPRLTYQIGID